MAALVTSRSKDPRSELRRTYDFIGLKDIDFTPDFAAHPRAQPDKPSLDAGTRAAYASAYNDDARALIAAFPQDRCQAVAELRSPGRAGRDSLTFADPSARTVTLR